MVDPANHVMRQYLKKLRAAFGTYARPKLAGGIGEDPQVDPGTMNIKTLNDIPVGEIVATTLVLDVKMLERWVIKNTGVFTPGLGFEVYRTGDQEWEGEGGRLEELIENEPVSTFDYTAMTCETVEPLSETEIEELEDTPSGLDRYEFVVRTVVGTNAPFVSGRLYRLVNPNAPDTFTDTWRLFPNYVKPTGGAAGTRLRVTPVTTPHTHLRGFLSDAIISGEQGLMIQTTYTYGSFPTQ